MRGLETEYGLQVRVMGPHGWRRLGSDEAATRLFAPVVAENRTTNVYLRNGGRLYLDVGSHPEYASAETSTLAELVAQDRAGDLVVSRLAVRLRESLAEQGQRAHVSVFKNNVDSHGNSYGSHENFQVSRALDLERLVGELTPFLVTRQLICGAGHWQRDRLGRGRFVLSQRAQHMADPLSSSTTRSRPLVNTRDEPHADAERFRRLHVLVGDSTLLETGTLLRVGSAELVLRALEAGAGAGPGLVVDDPAARIREVCADLTGHAVVTRDGRSALAVQRHYWELVGDVVDDEELRSVHRLWGRVLDALEAGAPQRVAGEVDWIAKLRLLQAQRERHQMRDDDPRLAALDLAWHDIVEEQGLARLAERRGQVTRWLPPGAADQAVDSPPSTTRAVLRSRFVEAAQRHRRSYGVDWMRFTCHDLADASVVVEDALATLDERVDRLVERMATEPRRQATSSFGSTGGSGSVGACP